jgi:hypothetical protein
MKFTIYEDPRTHAFALVALPNRFVDATRRRSVMWIDGSGLASRRSPRCRIA